jgi:excisionase family DNA binding protein
MTAAARARKKRYASKFGSHQKSWARGPGAWPNSENWDTGSLGQTWKNRSKADKAGHHHSAAPVQHQCSTGQTGWPNRTNCAAKRGKSGQTISQGDSLSVSDAADRLGVSARTVRRLCSSGQLHCFRTPGGQLRLRVADVEAYQQGSVSPAAPAASVSSGIVQNKRETLDTLRLELQERQFKRELAKLDQQDAGRRGHRCFFSCPARKLPNR